MTYILQIPKLKFKPVTPKIWSAIRWEGLDDEQDKSKRSQWMFAELKLKESDKNGLMGYVEETIEKFNRFDIQLKNIYKMKLIDLIEYDAGRVYIVRVR